MTSQGKGDVPEAVLPAGKHTDRESEQKKADRQSQTHGQTHYGIHQASIEKLDNLSEAQSNHDDTPLEYSEQPLASKISLSSMNESKDGGYGSGSSYYGESMHGNRIGRVNKPFSKLSNYAEDPSIRTSQSINTIDLDESLRSFYFAPTPLVVLDNNRTVKMFSKPAEIVFGVTDANYIGHRFENYVTSWSRPLLTTALNESVQNLDTERLSVPYSTKIAIQPTEGAPYTEVDISISAWYPTSPIFSGAPSRDTPVFPSSDVSVPGSTSSPVSPYDTASHRSLRWAGNSVPHEAFFTIAIIPIKSNLPRDSPSSEHSNIGDKLKVSLFDHIETPLMAMTSNGDFLFENLACQNLFRSCGMNISYHQNSQTDRSSTPISRINSVMTCWDDKFEVQYDKSQWPIYKCAILGQPSEPILMGYESQETGERIILETSGQPLRASAGYGEHVGGVVHLRNVTEERSRIRKEVQMESDLYFKQTCNSLPQLVWVTDEAGYHEWYSKSWYDYTGSTILESRGVGWQAFFHEDDLAEAGRSWSQSLRTGELYETAYRCKRHDGQWRWFLGRALPMRDHDTGTIRKWFGTCTDIHDQVEALASTKRAQSQLENVINHAGMTLWAVDRDGKITVAEGPGVRQLKFMHPNTPIGSEKSDILAQTPDENDEVETAQRSQSSNSHSSPHRYNMIGRSIYSIWDQSLTRSSIQKALEGETAVEEMELDGRWYRNSFTPLRKQMNEANMIMSVERFTESAEIIGVVGASLDVTDRKIAQEKMRESLLEKTRALAAEGAAREASRLKSEFLANMSHEIRTPIAGVIGLSELLLDERSLTEQQRDYAETIQRSAEGLLTVINDVLDFSKVEIGKLDVEKAPFHLETLIRDAKRMLKFATEKKSLEFKDRVVLQYKGQVIGDVGRLRQVITNLLTNAIKFTDQGYIDLEVAEVHEDDRSVVVKFDVRDTGCGISADALQKLFQPFSQADPSTARRFGGTGLGLSISKNLVELMDGKIGLESVEGLGSHAWFIIPFSKSLEILSEQRVDLPESRKVQSVGSTSNNPMYLSKSHNVTNRSRQDIWILVAEDNAINAQIASKNIKRMGFNCRIAENGLRALEELSKNRYDAVLMDCQMPECDGYEATQLIRKSLDSNVRTLPVIALTASAIKGDRERALSAGMVDYLAKPVKRLELEKTLCKWLYDQEARNKLMQYLEVAIEIIDRKGHTPSTARVPTTGATVCLREQSTSRGISTSPSSIASYTSSHEVMSPNTTEKLSAIHLSSTSEAVVDRIRTSDMTLHQSAKALLSTGDTLSAAAILMSARRASHDDSMHLFGDEQKSSRPTLPGTRSLSQGSIPKAGSAPFSKELTPTSFSNKRKAGDEGPQADTPDIHVKYQNSRAQRSQAGMGRDLDGEVLRATMNREPSLNEAIHHLKDAEMDVDSRNETNNH